MKQIGILILLLTYALVSWGQSSMLVGVRLLDTKQKPMAGETVSFIETTTNETVSEVTNQAGTVQTTLVGGKEWGIHFLGVQYKSTIKMPTNNRKGKTKISITYNPRKYIPKKTYDRNTITFKEIDQSRKYYSRPKKGKAVVNLKLKGRKGKSFAVRQPVALVCYATNKKYLSVTDSYGSASFLVPLGQTYSVDIGTATDYTDFDVPQREGLIMNQALLYVATKIKEKTRNDTIFQQLKPDVNDGTSERVFVRIQVKNPEGIEPVVLHSVKGKSIYKAYADKNGEARFLMPKNEKFMVHFRFQRDVDVVDLVNMWGIGTVELKLTHQKDPMLEHPETYLPTPDRLLTKGINSFLSKQYEKPKAPQKAGFYYRWGNKVNKKSKEAVLEIGFATVHSNQLKRYEPLNVSFVIDKSGSMAGYDRIESLQRSMIKFVDQLHPDDIVSLITFDTETKVVIPSQKRADGLVLKEKIGKIIPGGGTIIHDGLIAGYEEVLKSYTDNATNRVVLLTDGHGTTPVDTIVNSSKSYNSKGVELSAIGVGYGYNHSLLSLLATEGGGLLQHAGEADKIDSVFSHELNSVLKPIGKQAIFEIEHNKRIIFKQIYGMTAKSTGTNKHRIKMGRLFAGLNKVALVKFDLHRPGKSIEKQPIILRLSYFDFQTKKKVVIEEEARLQWSTYTGKLQAVKEFEHKKLYAIATLNQAMKVMAEANANKKFEEAKAVLVSTQKQIKKLFPKANQTDVNKLMEEVNGYVSTLNLILQKQKKSIK